MQHSQVGGTLITGTTGFVGGELLVKLLQQSDRSLICPVRAASNQAAVERGQARLAELVGGIDASRFAPRITWLRADIEEPQLGWSSMRWHQVASRTTEIFHCAASVSFDLPLDQAHRINVAGTVHMFELATAAAARHGNFARFHHVSTAYVAGTARGRVDADFLPTDRAGNFRNTYERTKARAERYLRTHASTRVPVSIHRPSIIAGDRDTGRTTNWNVLYVPMKMAARGHLPVFPHGGREIVDTVAVDYLVDGMIVFAALDTKSLESHHLTAGATAFSVTDLMRTTVERVSLVSDDAPAHVRLLGRGRWKALEWCIALAARAPKRAGRVRSKARLARRGIDGCSVYLPYTRVNAIFDDARDSDLLRVHGVEMPAGQQYLNTILDYALATNFGRSVEPTVVAAAA